MLRYFNFAPSSAQALRCAYFTTQRPRSGNRVDHHPAHALLLCHCFILKAVQESPPAVHRLRLSVLGLGPDLPWADEPSPGNLRLSTGMFLACLSLLIPAFSLEYSPLVLPLQLLPVFNAPLPLAKSESYASVSRLSPGTSSAHDHSTSELLRTL